MLGGWDVGRLEHQSYLPSHKNIQFKDLQRSKEIEQPPLTEEQHSVGVLVELQKGHKVTHLFWLDHRHPRAHGKSWEVTSIELTGKSEFAYTIPSD